MLWPLWAVLSDFNCLHSKKYFQMEISILICAHVLVLLVTSLSRAWLCHLCTITLCTYVH